MATDSKWNNVPVEKPTLLDPRASVATRYAPSEFTFNANWSPAPLVASSSSSSPFGLLYARDDEAERVSHLDFDDDDDEHDNDEHDGWRGDEDSPGLIRPIRRPSDPFADSNAAYLASYGFTNGLGYERPPDVSSSSSSSSYSNYNGDNAGNDDFNSNYNANNGDSNRNSKFAANNNPKFLNDHPSSQNTRSKSRRTESYRESPWPLSHKASNALLASLALDAPLRDDPCGAWEALCWDQAAPEGDSDDEDEDEDESERKGLEGRRESAGEVWENGRRQQVGRRDTWRRKDIGHAIEEEEEEEEEEDVEDRWRNFLSPRLSSAPSRSRPRSHSPAPYPTTRDDNTAESDVRTISNETSNSTGTSSTITTTTTATADEEGSEEWISLTAARAQAARARILPSRAFSPPSTAVPPVQVQVPFPTHAQADPSTLVTHLEGGGRRTRTPVDPVLMSSTPPPLLPISAYQLDPEHENANANGERRESEDGGEAETETAPHYGESGRDRLLTLTERDPPPYDLEYGPQMRQEEDGTQMGGDAEEMVQSRDVNISLHASSSTPYLTHSSIPHPHARSRSQLTFPTSPTDSLPTLTSRTSPTSPSPTETLTTPAGAFFSTLFPAPTPVSHSSPAEDSIHYAPGSPKGSKEREGERESRLGAGSPLSLSVPVERMGSAVFNELPARPGVRTISRPLPARPRGARTTAGAWLSASAAGPYASGTRSVYSISSSGWGSPSSSDFGSHFALNNGNGNGNGNGWLPPPPLMVKVSTEVVVNEDDVMRMERSAFWKGRGEEEREEGEGEGRRSTVTLTPLRRGDFFPTPSSLSLPISSSPSSSLPAQHHPNSSQNRLPEKSEKSMEKERESIKKEQRKNVNKGRSNSESHITSTVEAIGTRSRHEHEHRDRDRSSRPLQRLATRCGTLSRRIGIVAGVGGGR